MLKFLFVSVKVLKLGSRVIKQFAVFLNSRSRNIQVNGGLQYPGLEAECVIQNAEKYGKMYGILENS